MRVKRGIVRKRKHNKYRKAAKGYRDRRGTCFKLSKDAVEKALVYAYRDRKVKKREFRRLWITRINAAARLFDLSYSKFMRGLSLAKVELDRKSLADIAMNNPESFAKIAEKAKGALASS